MFSLPSKFRKQYCNDVILFKTTKPDGSLHPIQVAWGLRKNRWVLLGQLHEWYSKKIRLAQVLVYWVTGPTSKVGFNNHELLRHIFTSSMPFFLFIFFLKKNVIIQVGHVKSLILNIVFFFFFFFNSISYNNGRRRNSK